MKYIWMLSAALIFTTTACSKKTVKSTPKTTRVKIAALKEQTFRQRIPLQGTVQPVEFATISAKVSGTMEVFEVDEGDQIKKGTLLFSIDRQVLKNQVTVKEDEIQVRKAAVQSAESALEIANVSLKQAQRDRDRAANLAKSKAISESSVEAANTDFEKARIEVNTATANVANAKAQLKQAESNLEIAKKNLEDSTIYAPFDGVVFDKFVEKNEFVSSGQDILKLENHKELEVVCFLSAVYYDQVIENQTPVNFTGSNKRGVISYKAPGIDPESRTFKIKAKVPAETGLVSGMLCELDIILTERTGYGLPESAVLLRADDKMIAFTMTGDKKAMSVNIEKGITDNGMTEILNGKEYLDRKFVVSGQTFINNGALLSEITAEDK
jgi:RND family efflux transporter MFP subunit